MNNLTGDGRPESSYTVPALRDQAEQLRKRAEEALRKAAYEAEEFRKAANELESIADAMLVDRQPRQQRPETPAIGAMASCPGCRQPVAWDGLGWTHATATDCTADLTGVEAQRDGGPQE